MIIIAHRGASAYFEENTITAFKGALAMGATYFETDVQLSKDGQMVIYHDYNLKAPTKPAIKDLTYQELKQHNIPLMQEVLAVLGKEINLNIEIKNDGNLYPNIEEKLLALLNTPAAFKERILISSFDFDTLARVRALDKNIKIGRLTRAFDIKEALALNAYSVNISNTRITKEIVDICHDNKIKVLVYTVNTYKEALALQAMGVDGIFSDYPDIMQKKI